MCSGKQLQNTCNLAFLAAVLLLVIVWDKPLAINQIFAFDGKVWLRHTFPTDQALTRGGSSDVRPKRHGTASYSIVGRLPTFWEIRPWLLTIPN